MPACWAMAGVGQRRTHQRVLLTRSLITGRIFSITSFILSAGTSDISVMLWLPRTAM